MTRYGSIVADPPWPHRTFMRGAERRHWDPKAGGRPIEYPTLEVEAICALPVAELALPDCRLFLWATNRFLPAGFDVLEAWGFRYVQTLVWRKTGAPNPWGGSLAPNHAEYLLAAVKGKPARLAFAPSNVLDVPMHSAFTAHSQKPDAFLDLVEAVSPGPYLELFARRQRLGWDTWGNQALNHVQLSLEEAPWPTGASNPNGNAALPKAAVPSLEEGQ